MENRVKDEFKCWIVDKNEGRGIKNVEMTCPRFPMWVKGRTPSFHANGGITYQRYCKP